MSYYLEVGKTFVPMIQYSEAIKEMTGKFDCMKIKPANIKQTNHHQNKRKTLNWIQFISKAKG